MSKVTARYLTVISDMHTRYLTVISEMTARYLAVISDMTTIPFAAICDMTARYLAVISEVLAICSADRRGKADLASTIAAGRRSDRERSCGHFERDREITRGYLPDRTNTCVTNAAAGPGDDARWEGGAKRY